MQTHDTYAPTSHSELKQHAGIIIDNSYKQYCRPKDEVEREIQARLGAKEDEEADAKDAPGSVAGVEPEPTAISLPEPPAHPTPAKQTPEPVPATISMDTMNTLYAQLKAKTLDPDTTILASLGEHYVMTIKQWMRLFEWKAYPKATPYFKELKENDLIYRKDREGRDTC
jgi:hypothetical protein